MLAAQQISANLRRVQDQDFRDFAPPEPEIVAALVNPYDYPTTAALVT